MRRLAVLALTLLIAIALGGCAMFSDENDYLGRDDSKDTPIQERGTFEDARTRLDQMVDQIATEVTAAFPDCPPMARKNGPDSVTGGGGTEEWVNGVWPYRVSSQSRSMDCTISDTRERADIAIEIVARIAEDYGFRPRITFNDRVAPDGEGYVAFEGWSTDGDKYSFGSAVVTNINYTAAPRFTAEQLEAIKAGRTPPQPLLDSLMSPSPTAFPGRPALGSERIA